jgi:hypothetical protein
MPSSEWGLRRETVGRWCLMGHQCNPRSHRVDSPNSPYPEYLQIPPKPTPWGFPHSPRSPDNLEYCRRELKTRQHKVIYCFHLGHLSRASAIAETRPFETGKILHPRPCFPRYLSQSSVRANLLLVGRLPSDEGGVQDLEAFSKHCSASLILGRSPGTGFQQRSKDTPNFIREPRPFRSSRSPRAFTLNDPQITAGPWYRENGTRPLRTSYITIPRA